MLAFVYRRWFLLALVLVLFAGIGWPDAMQPIVPWLPGDVILAVVTFTMALPLGWLASRMLPAELAVGVILAATVPCTLASAAVWTRRAGGNDAVAFLVTMITNLACFLVIPAWLLLLVGIRADVDFREIVLGLMLLVVLPILTAQVLRQWPLIGSWATRHKELLSGLAQLGVLLMVFVGAVNCGERLAAVDSSSIASSGNIAMMIVAVTMVHVILLVMGFSLSRMFRIARADAIGVAFSGSQKTLMVGAYLAMAVGPLAILPMVAYHAAQLVIDTLIADRWRQGELDSVERPS
jgi:sodium/bile acid cotransporter 7